jgi:hypothetical protein
MGLPMFPDLRSKSYRDASPTTGSNSSGSVRVSRFPRRGTVTSLHAGHKLGVQCGVGGAPMSMPLCPRPESPSGRPTRWERLSVLPQRLQSLGRRGVCVGEPLRAQRALNLLGGLVDKSMISAKRSGKEMRYRILESA